MGFFKWPWIRFSQSEVDNLLNCITIAQIEQRKGLHCDSPEFWVSVENLRIKLWNAWGSK